MPGVTSTGFVPKTITELSDELKALWRSVFGAAVNVADRSRNGQLIQNLAAPLAEVWKLGESITSFFSNPSGVMLDYVSKLTGTTRKAATSSSVVLTLTGTPTTVVASGKIAAVNGTTAQFQTTAPGTIAAVTAWAQGVAVVAGNRRTANGNVYLCQVGGTTAAVGTGPAGTGVNIDDNGVKWDFLGAGTGAIDVAAQATVTGPVQGYSRTISIISTPVSGWNGVINILDATPGTNQETDAELRVRRAQEVSAQGTSPLDALRAQLLKVSSVTTASVFENTLDVAVDGIAAHGIEALVEGGADADIRAAIFASEAGGIETSGTTSGSVVDSAGNSHTIKFSRPTEVDIYVGYVLLVDPSLFPADGLDQVKAAAVAAGDLLQVGRDVFNAVFSAAAMQIAGVLNVTSCFVDTVGPPLLTQVVISPRQRAAFDTSRVSVATTPGSP
jgi:uncharacterized phage protein gp47/JayE